MKRFHIHIGVNNLADSIRFYNALFGAGPVKVKSDYAKWMLEDPCINFAISTRAGKHGVEHLGIQVDDATELEALRNQFSQANISTHSDGEQVLLKNYDTKPISHDLMIDLIHLSKEIHEKCVVMSSFNKRILPIIRNGNLSASFEQDYELINVPQFLKVNLVNLQNEQLSQLKQCSIKGSIFIVGHTVVNAVANELQCKINGINVSFRLMSSLSVKNTLSCVKSIEYLPEFIQPCKKLILSKNKKVSLMLASNFDDVTLSHDEISKKIAQEAFGK